MIFTTVGSSEYAFDRLVKAVDDLAKLTGSAEVFVIQIGTSKYVPLNAKWFRFEIPERLLEWINQSEIVITHGGFGTIGDCIRARKKIISCPRLPEFGEAGHYHQDELVNYLARNGVLIALNDVGKLAEAIEEVRRMGQSDWPFESKIPTIVADFVINKIGSTRL